MRLAVDVMGGDHGPGPIVAGVAAALAGLAPGLEAVLVGRAAEVRAHLAGLGPEVRRRIELLDAAQVVEVDDAPAAALRRKPDSSVRRAAELVRSGGVDGVISAGSTGAVVAAMTVLAGLIPGVDRAAIAAVLPLPAGPVLLLDAGANVDCRPGWLVQFAHMGRLYAEAVLGIRSPRVALLSVGEEESKGDERVREAHRLLRASALNFVGNADGRDVFAGRADVLVCDGFTGNVLLKAEEAIPAVAAAAVRAAAGRSLRQRLGLWLAGPALERAWARLDWESYGGAPLLGVEGACIICHGRSGPRAIGNAVRVARDFVQGQVRERIRERLQGVA